MHQVVCVCKRMGGGFGGKETQAAIPAMMAALVATKTGRAARVVYNKDDDMCSTGKRHAYRAEWEVGFDDDGRILAYRVQFYSDGGAAADLSTSVMERRCCTPRTPTTSRTSTSAAASASPTSRPTPPSAASAARRAWRRWRT